MKKSLAATAVITVGALALSGCTTLTASTSNDVVQTESSDVDPGTVTAVTNIDNTQNLKAGERVKVTAQSPWVIESVTVGGPTGDSDVAITSPDQWVSAPLEPLQATSYRIKMRNSSTGQTTELSKRVVTSGATSTFTADLTPDLPKKGGPTSYGVGIIPKVTFTKEVPVSSRKALTDRIKATANGAPIDGSWRWLDSTTAAYRPATQFWPGHATITLSGDLTNARLAGGKGKSDAWGRGTVSTTFKTARALVINLDGRSDQGYATIDGKKVKRFGISLGRPGFTTRSGVKTITDIIRVQRMTNEGVTNTETYDLQVPFAMRMTDTGEFLHGAPWNGNIGYANTSHGCSNLTYDVAQWFFNRVKYGDPVITKGTGRKMELWNGPGALWNVPYAKWASVKT